MGTFRKTAAASAVVANALPAASNAGPAAPARTAARIGRAATTWTPRVARALKGRDAVEVLTLQHRQIRRGFLQAALPGPYGRRAFDRLIRLLAVHEAAEEAHVHPMARRALRAGREVAARRREEEKEAKKLLVELWRTGPYGLRYLRLLSRARQAVVRHAAQEEREEFSALRDAVGMPRLRLLAAEVRLTQRYAPTRPHRWVNNEATNKIAVPLLGPFDRGRDAFRERFAS